MPEEKDDVIAAFNYLRSQPFVDPQRVGIMGISAGGSLVAAAAEDPRISDRVRLVELFGSYYDANDLLSALTLRRIRVDGKWREWQPEQVSVDVFRDMLLSTLPKPDRTRLSPLFDRKTTAIPDGLSPPGRAVASLLANRDPERMGTLVAALPPRTKRFLAGISPKTRVSDLRTELFLMHDRDDDIIPFTESTRFYNEADGTRGKHLTVLHLFRHVQPSGGSNPLALAREGGKLYRHIYSVFVRLA